MWNSHPLLANLEATKRIHVPPEIFETVVPLGAMLHKDDSVIAAISIIIAPLACLMSQEIA